MTLRRIVALLVLAFDAYVVFRVAPSIGMLGPALQLIGVLVGIGALGVLVFNLPLERRRRTRRQHRGSAASHGDSPLIQRAAGLVGVLLFVIAPLLIAARGAYLGVLPSFVRPRGPEVSFSQTPGLFALNFLAYAGLGLAFLFLLQRARREKEAA